MMANNKVIMVVSLVIVATTTTMVSPVAGISATATFYTPPYTPSACFGTTEEGTTIAAASEALFDGGAACGHRYVVKCTGGTNQGVAHPCTGRSVTVRIVDLCPSGGCRATIDLSQEAFAVIADPDAGKINIEFHNVGVLRDGNAAEGTTIAAASKVLWNGRAACGARYVVKCTCATNQGVPHPCTGRSVTVKIVDLCPAGGCRATIDLSQEAFAVIADPDAGKTNIEFHKV